MLRIRYVRRKYQETLIEFEVQEQHEQLIPARLNRVHYNERIYVVSDVIFYIGDNNAIDRVTVMLEDWVV